MIHRQTTTITLVIEGDGAALANFDANVTYNLDFGDLQTLLQVDGARIVSATHETEEHGSTT